MEDEYNEKFDDEEIVEEEIDWKKFLLFNFFKLIINSFKFI